MWKIIGVAAVAASLYAFPASAACGIEGVVLYQADWCPFCKAVKRYFAIHHVLYKEYDVDNDAAAQKAMVDTYGTKMIPLTVVDNGEPILGFDIEALRAALCIPKR